MRKAYQNEEIGTNQPGMPETVSVELAEMAGEMREGTWPWWSGPGCTSGDRDHGRGPHRDVWRPGQAPPGPCHPAAYPRHISRERCPGYKLGTNRTT